MSVDKDVVEYLSRERGIDPAFIEKDWHAVRVLKELSGFSEDQVVLIFTGGTSLSKAHGLLKRFSEDLDFRVKFQQSFSSNNQLKKKKGAIRTGIIEILRSVSGLTFSEENIVADGLGFKIQLSYEKLFEVPTGMRPELQIELSFTEPRLGAEQKEIASFVSEYKKEKPETSFLCLSPVEIAADKFSSLVWRVQKRNREDEKDDPAMVRHLHDLVALQNIINANSVLFIKTALESFFIDQQQKSRQVNTPLKEAAIRSLQMMHEDELYRSEYDRFVDAMSYASDDERITFDDALNQFGKLASLIK
jgi:hypothetical protein